MWLIVQPIKTDFAEDLEVVTYDDIRKEYNLVSAKCELLREHPDTALEVASK